MLYARLEVIYIYIPNVFVLRPQRSPDSEKCRYSVSNFVNRYMGTSYIKCKNSRQGCTSSINLVGTRQRQC